MDDPTAQTPASPTPAGVAASPTEQVEALAAEAADTGDTLVVRDEKFRMADQIPAIIMLKMTAAGSAKVSPAEQMSAIVDFLTYIIEPDERDRFMQYLADADPVIGFEELNGIVQTATEVIAARPTEQP